jgi:hypothetical protein
MLDQINIHLIILILKIVMLIFLFMLLMIYRGLFLFLIPEKNYFILVLKWFQKFERKLYQQVRLPGYIETFFFQ